MKLSGGGSTMITARSVLRLLSSPYCTTSMRPYCELTWTCPLDGLPANSLEAMRNAGGSLTTFGTIFHTDRMPMPTMPNTSMPMA